MLRIDEAALGKPAAALAFAAQGDQAGGTGKGECSVPFPDREGRVRATRPADPVRRSVTPRRAPARGRAS
ncbi:hypothetical protein GCM10009634_38270 [Saccharothrix xinjiangensis]